MAYQKSVRGFWVVLLCCLSSTSSGLIIDTRFIEPGQWLPSVGTAGGVPASAVGEGHLASIVRAAADVWQELIPDEHTVVIHFGWFNTSAISPTAYHQGIAYVGSPKRPTQGSIVFNNDPTSSRRFYLDATPQLNDEFYLSSQSVVTLSGVTLGSRDEHRGSTEEVLASADLFSTALHELGHAIALTGWDDYLSEIADGDIDVTTGPYAGIAIPALGTHLDIPGAVLTNQGRPNGHRRGITQVDLAAVCAAGNYAGCNYGLLDASSPHGDFNADGLIDVADYVVWRDGYNRPIAQPYNGADADGDSFVSLAEVGVWRTNYDAGPGPGLVTAPNPVPEPAAWLAALLAAATATSATRRG